MHFRVRRSVIGETNWRRAKLVIRLKFVNGWQMVLNIRGLTQSIMKLGGTYNFRL